MTGISGDTGTSIAVKQLHAAVAERGWRHDHVDRSMTPAGQAAACMTAAALEQQRRDVELHERAQVLPEVARSLHDQRGAGGVSAGALSGAGWRPPQLSLL